MTYKPLTYSSGIFWRVPDGSVFLLFAFLNNQLGFLPRLLEQSQSLWGHFFTLSVFNRDFFHILRTTKNDVLGELHFKAVGEAIKITEAFPTYSTGACLKKLMRFSGTMICILSANNFLKYWVFSLAEGIKRMKGLFRWARRSKIWGSLLNDGLLTMSYYLNYFQKSPTHRDSP